MTRLQVRSAPSPADNICRDVTTILAPLLEESLYPRTFTGKLGLSINFQSGSVRPIKSLDREEQVPGVVRESPAGGLAGWDNVMESVIRDLRGKLAALLAGYSGSLALTIEVDSGICRKVVWERERFFRTQGE